MSLKDMMVEVVNCVSGLYELIINIGAELSDAVVFCTGKLQAMSNIVKKLSLFVFLVPGIIDFYQIMPEI